MWTMANGKIPNGMEIDHIDRDKQNNKLSNLRVVTPHENMLNCADRPSKFGRGIKQTASGKFGARTHDKWLGSFDTVEEAQAARQIALTGN